jgi:hypothetical protein
MCFPLDLALSADLNGLENDEQRASSHRYDDQDQGKEQLCAKVQRSSKVLCALDCNAKGNTFRSGRISSHYSVCPVRMFACWASK